VWREGAGEQPLQNTKIVMAINCYPDSNSRIWHRPVAIPPAARCAMRGVGFSVRSAWHRDGELMELDRNIAIAEGDRFFVCPPEGGLGSSWLKHGFSVFRFKNSKRPILSKQQAAS
jgi:hypothetical protein